MQRRSVVEYVVNEHGCWIWQLARNSRGYGVRWDPKERRLKLAHRWYYERQHGAVPEGRQLDHLCTVRACVNPAHLEAVSPRQNVQRSVARRPRKPPRIREEPRLRPVDPAECKCWQGCRDRDGYGAKWADGKRVFVHRWVYEQVHGPIPDGLTIDHLCKEPRLPQHRSPGAGQPFGEHPAEQVAAGVSAWAPDDAAEHHLGEQWKATMPNLPDRQSGARGAAEEGATTSRRMIGSPSPLRHSGRGAAW